MLNIVASCMVHEVKANVEEYGQVIVTEEDREGMVGMPPSSRKSQMKQKLIYVKRYINGDSGPMADMPIIGDVHLPITRGLLRSIEKMREYTSLIVQYHKGLYQQQDVSKACDTFIDTQMHLLQHSLVGTLEASCLHLNQRTMSDMLSSDSKISSIDFGKDAHSLPQRCINLQNLSFLHQNIDMVINYAM